MKNLLLLIIVAGAAYYGLNYFPQGQDLLAKLPQLPTSVPQQVESMLPQAPTDVVEDASALPELTKCTTAAGEVIYGDVPEGTVCARTEKVDGALTVVPSRAIVGDGRASVPLQQAEPATSTDSNPE